MAARPASPLALPPRGLSRGDAARYLGFGTEIFDKLVIAGLMPHPKRIFGRLVWDRLEIDAAFSDLHEVTSADLRSAPDRILNELPIMADEWTPRA